MEAKKELLKDDITFEMMKEIINSILSDFYKNDAILFNYKTESDSVAERCMVFHIGWYLLNVLKKYPMLSNANVDSEYNRNFNHSKGMYEKTLSGIKEKMKDTYPDLIIHQRKSNANNIAIMEFKKGRQDKKSKQNDVDKLVYFTDESNEYRYKFGFYIELYKNNSAKIEVFEKGKIIGNRCFKWPATS